MYTKKSLGQHFLKSERALLKIIESANILPGETVLEIGPGTGALTEKLLKTGSKLTAVEKDDNLYALIKNKFWKEIQLGQLTLIHDDILNFDPGSRYSKARSYKLISNIPYNITGAIIKKFLESRNQPSMMVLLVQKEVAKRIIAKDGKESILSISVKAYGTPKYIEEVKAGSFVPAPKVDSAIIVIDNISKTFFEVFSEKNFFDLVHTGFRSKRKKLSSNLGTLFSKDAVNKIFSELGLDSNLRAEDVTIGIWKKLAHSLRAPEERDS